MTTNDSSNIISDADTLRGSLSDAVNEIHKLLLKSRDPDQERKLRELRDAYFKLWEAVIQQEIDRNTEVFGGAIASLKEASVAVTRARQSNEDVADAIEKAAAAAKAVDRIVNIGIKLLA